MRKIRTTAALAALVLLTQSGCIPAIGVLAVGLGATMDAKHKVKGVSIKPTLRPEQVKFVVSTSQYSPDFRVLDPNEYDRAAYLQSFRFDGPLPRGVVAMAKTTEGRYLHVYPQMVQWDPAGKVYAVADTIRPDHPWHYGW